MSLVDRGVAESSPAPDPSPDGPVCRPAVDVIVLTWNDGELLERAVASALDATDVDVNVIVVDNGSEPAANVPPGVTLLRNEANVGVAAGRNQGIRAGSAPVVCLLDSDAELTPGALRRLIGELDRTGASLVVPVFAGQVPEASAGRAPGVGRKVLRVLGVTACYRSTPRVGASSWPVDFGIGACQVFTRARWAEVGGIDDSYFYGPEDVDFCLRIGRWWGDVRQVDGAPVIHPPRRRHRRPIDTAGLAHLRAVARYLWRHRWHLYGGSGVLTSLRRFLR